MSLEDTVDFLDRTSDKYIKRVGEETTKIDKKIKDRGEILETFLLVVLDWRFIFITLLIITLLIAIAIFKVHQWLMISKQFTDVALKGVNFAGHIFILNCFIAVFTISFYFYKKKHQGKNGPKGNRGPRGEQGKNMECDICSLKIKKFQKDSAMVDNDLIDDSLFKSINKIGVKRWNERKLNDSIGNASLCKKCEKSIGPNVPFVTGIIANYEDYITSLQYLYINSDGKTDLLGGKKGVWGNKDKKTNVQEIKCPSNSAINRIDAIYNNEKGIKGLKIFCKDRNTGENIDLKNNIIGQEPKQGGSFKYTSSQCGMEIVNEKSIPAFLSGLSCNHDNQSIKRLNYKYCKYFS